MKDPIAETKMLMKSPNGDSKSIHVEIGLPYVLSDEEAACPISMTELYPKIHDIHGIDTLQALALTFEFIRVTVRKWEEKGFTFEFPQGGKLPPEIWFEQKTK